MLHFLRSYFTSTYHQNLCETIHDSCGIPPIPEGYGRNAALHSDFVRLSEDRSIGKPKVQFPYQRRNDFCSVPEQLTKGILTGSVVFVNAQLHTDGILRAHPQITSWN